jgi:hypothetical protein
LDAWRASRPRGLGLALLSGACAALATASPAAAADPAPDIVGKPIALFSSSGETSSPIGKPSS